MFKAIQMAVAAGLMIVANAALGQVQVDKNIPDYKAVAGVSGNVKSVGSDSLNNLMTLWAEGFKKAYPNISIEIEGKGSATAPPALIEGTAQLGPMSRSMKESEVDDFKKKYGYAPVPVRVAVDALAVFVNKDNPIKELSFDQLRTIFSVEGKEGITWGEVGVTGDLASKPDLALWQKFRLGHVRVLQGTCPGQEGFQGDGEGAARQQRGGAGRGGRQDWHRIFRRGLCHGRREGGSHQAQSGRQGL